MYDNSCKTQINPITSEDVRFKYYHPEVVQYTGSIPELSYFDAQFFKVHFRLSSNMDPMGKKVLEQAYNAIYDAGKYIYNGIGADKSNSYKDIFKKKLPNGN